MAKELTPRFNLAMMSAMKARVRIWKVMAAPWSGPAFFVLLATAGVLSWWFMSPLQPRGDENFYTNAAVSVAHAIRAAARLDFSLVPQALEQVQGDGWFMPGMAVLLLPVTLLFGGESPAWALRLWVLMVNAGLLTIIGRSLRRRLSDGAALVFLGVILMSPYFTAYLSTLWGDVVGILLVVLFVLWCDGHMSADREIPGIKAGLFLAGIVYVRSLFLPLLPVLSAGILLTSVRRHGLNAGAALRWARRTLVVGGVFFAALAPWSAWQTSRFGFTIATTSLPISQLRLFSSPTTWRTFADMHTSAMNQAKEHVRTYMEEARAMRDAVMRNVSTAEKIGLIGANAHRYYLEPSSRMNQFLNERYERGATIESRLATAVLFLTTAWWTAVLVAGALAFVVPFDVDQMSYIPAFFYKAVAFIVGAQPLYAFAHGRYHVQLFPVVGLVLAFLWARRFRPYTRASLRSDPGLLVGAGQAIAIAFAALTFGLLIAF